MTLNPQTLLDTPSLLEALDTAIDIPVIPYRDGQIDFAGHAKNIDYLMQNNYLEGGRKRAIAIAGTSLLHHISAKDQLRLIDETGQCIGDDGILIAGVVPNPLTAAGDLIEAESQLQRPPDAYLLMPLAGVSNPEGIYEEYLDFAAEMGENHNARFLYYFKQPRERDALIRLLNDSPHFIGVKVGTSEEDVQPLVEGVGDSGLVIWGIGDRSTRAAELGAKGHTSGIAVVVAKASDEINNAQRRGDYETSRQIEQKISALEEIRFRNGRIYNYSAVVEAMNLSGFDDIEGGEGGPFNPRVPAEIAQEVETAIADIKVYH